jgi:hypothetical protein
VDPLTMSLVADLVVVLPRCLVVDYPWVVRLQRNSSYRFQ